MEPLSLEDYDVPTSPRNEQEPVAEHADPQPEMEENLGVQDLGVDEAVRTQTRRPVAKMDAKRMLDPHRGLPKLQKVVKSVRFKGRGHERRDLIKLLGTYQMWGHRLFPKANFDDLLALCQRTGHDVAVRSWRRSQIDDEKYGYHPVSETDNIDPRNETPIDHDQDSQTYGDQSPRPEVIEPELVERYHKSTDDLRTDHQPEPSHTPQITESHQWKDNIDSDEEAAASAMYEDLGF